MQPPQPPLNLAPLPPFNNNEPVEIGKDTDNEDHGRQDESDEDDAIEVANILLGASQISAV
jgi:hypothetical protein